MNHKEGVPQAILRASVTLYRPTQVHYPSEDYQIMTISLRSMLTETKPDWLSRRKIACQPSHLLPLVSPCDYPARRSSRLW